jgi:hypothetical protein
MVNLAVEIAATVPQLAGYLDQLAFAESTELGIPSNFSHTPIESQLLEPSVPAKCTGPLEYNSRFGEEPSPLTKGTPRKPSATSVFYADCNDEELHVNAQHTLHIELTRWNGAQPTSIHHMLFQLYTLRTVSLLPEPLKDWIQGRIRWMQNITDSENLARLRDNITKRRSDGFLI